MRKHISQMTADEHSFVIGYVRSNVAKLCGSGHYYDRASERSFTFEQVRDVVSKGLLIELNDHSNDIRALIRRKTGECVVVSLKSFSVITAYYNNPSDHHSTLDRTAYHWRVNAVELVKSLKK